MTVFYRRLPKFQYFSPNSLDEVLAFMAEQKDQTRLLAGGTDLIPALRKREMDRPGYVVDLKGIAGLDLIFFDEEEGLKIGPLVTIDQVARSPVTREHFPALAQAASSMASPQVRNRGTIAGNICNAVPSADSAPALLALGASVKIKALKGERTVLVDQFFVGPRKTVLDADEMVVEISIPLPVPGTRGMYLKLSPRHSMDLAIVGVAAVGGIVENGVCTHIKIALGAVAPTPVRAPMAEAMLLGHKITPGLIDEAAKNAVTQCSPIDDHRASQEYRCDMIYAMTRRALNQILQ